MTSKHKDKDRDRDRDEESGHSRGKSRDRDRDRRRDRSRSRDRHHRDRDRDRERDRDRDRERDRDRDRDRELERVRRDRRRSRSRDRDRRRRSRSKSYDNDKRRSRDRERDRYDRGSSRTAEAAGSSRGLRAPSRDQEVASSSAYDYKDIQFTQNVIESMMSTAANAKSFADLLNSYNQQQQIQQQQQHIQAQKALLEAHNENSQSSDPGRASRGGSSGSGYDGSMSRAQKKKSRWGGGDHDKTFIPGMPTILPAGMTQDQQEAYLVQLQIEELSRRLRTGDLMIPQNPEERSPSPEPIYSSDGKRLNTREFRTRKKLEEQRHQLITRMQCMNPEFKPPSDYKPPIIRVSDKVLIPQEEHPDINFVGLLIGPRGNTLKAMEKDTGAKIIIRGKGSVKEGKVGRKDGQPLPGEDEPLHAFITASNPESVKKAVDRIKDVIRQGIEVPEGHNDLRRMQLRELAQLNGTLREMDGPRCTNCGSNEHKTWLCPDKPNITNTTVCSSCGGAGHIAKDCRSKRPGAGGPPSSNNQTKIDEEYMSLMAELGEGPPPETTSHSHSNAPNRTYGLFEPRQAPRPLMQTPHMPPAHQPSLAPPPAAPMPQPPQWNMPPLPGPPPPPPGISPLMSWNQQPPPPGGAGSDLAPPGTAPVPRFPQNSYLPPPPPGVSQPLAPPGTSPVGMPSWSNGNGSSFMQPPPMPAGLPPAHLLSAPPPPPPPSSC
ncbi:splicing factor 1 [Uranotaenia lowii]|uniref:splicing factor 1 n=1 Tax=Uranotaenia lowii TaxID=190385 RepID=UPI002478FB65|nr:splicing factor 1 [Uranotaenia lowii]